MKKNLVNQRQEFGSVHNSDILPNTMTDKPMGHKEQGKETMRGNNAVDHGPPIHDVTIAARNRASEHVDNPFYWAGHPKRSA